MIQQDVSNSELSKFRILDASLGGTTRKRQLYTDDEWNEILEFVDVGITIPQLPSLPESLTDLKMLGASLVDTEPPEFPELGATLLELYRRYTNESMSQTSHNERAYDTFWKTLIEGAFDRTDLYIAGGETSSVSIKDVLNFNHQPGEGKSNYAGPKFDGIILSKDMDMGVDRIEYGYLEISKDAHKAYEQKYIYDHTKILKGMIVSYLGHMDWKKGIRVSIMCLGLELVVLYLKRHGDIYVLYTRPVVRLPARYSPKALGAVLSEIAILRYLLKLVKEEEE